MGNARNYQLRKTRLAEDQLKSNSVTSINELKDKQKEMHDLNMNNAGGYHEHSKSLMKGSTEEFNLVDKRKEIL